VGQWDLFQVCEAELQVDAPLKARGSKLGPLEITGRALDADGFGSSAPVQVPHRSCQRPPRTFKLRARLGSVRLGANVPLTVELASGPLANLRASRLRGLSDNTDFNVTLAMFMPLFMQSRSCKAAAAASGYNAAARGSKGAVCRPWRPGVTGSGLPSGSLLSEIHGPVVVPVVASVAVREVD
jgi:hypothetical protein